MCSLLAKDLSNVITRASLITKEVKDDLQAKIDGLEELNILLYDRDTNVCLETSNLAGAANYACTISLKEFQSPTGAISREKLSRIVITNLQTTRSVGKGT
jgi:hypothetical protein